MPINNRSPRICRAVLLSVGLLFSSSDMAQAHTMERAISIANNAVLQAAPETFTVSYVHPARFGSVQLRTATGETVPMRYQPPANATTTFTIPLPKLVPDTYRLTWRVIADDGHVMTGNVTFTIARR
jgi:methionine-rich copper-binding protein CopC